MTTISGSKDRLERAKTIDLCQNPLTVSSFLGLLGFYSTSWTLCLCETMNANLIASFFPERAKIGKSKADPGMGSIR